MGEIQTAEASDGSVRVQSPQTDPTPKSGSGKASASTGSKPKAGKRSPITSKMQRPEVDERGVVKTKWDNPDADPNLRSHIGEDPTGESNVID